MTSEPPAGSDDDLAAAKRDLLWRMKATAGSRFNAFERLRARDKRINILNAVASASVIFLSVVPAAVHTNEVTGLTITLATVFASIMILVTALVQFASDDAVNAERMHQCGLQINQLRRRLLYKDIVDRRELAEFAEHYDEILARHPNHASADYQRYRDENPDEFQNQPQRGKGPGGVAAERAERFSVLAATFLVGLSAAIGLGLALWLEQAGTIARLITH